MAALNTRIISRSVSLSVCWRLSGSTFLIGTNVYRHKIKGSTTEDRTGMYEYIQNIGQNDKCPFQIMKKEKYPNAPNPAMKFSNHNIQMEKRNPSHKYNI